MHLLAQKAVFLPVMYSFKPMVFNALVTSNERMPFIRHCHRLIVYLGAYLHDAQVCTYELVHMLLLLSVSIKSVRRNLGDFI